MRLTPWFAPSLHPAPSRIHGQGIFTRERILPGEVVMRWGGLVIPRAVYDRSIHRPGATTTYDEESYLTVLAADPPGLDELLNHSCDANTWMLDAVTVAARRVIEPGEEVLTDAAQWDDDPEYLHADPCGCGSPLCRGTIRGDDWRVPAVQALYRDHFAPFLNARIRAQAVGR